MTQSIGLHKGNSSGQGLRQSELRQSIIESSSKQKAPRLSSQGFLIRQQNAFSAFHLFKPPSSCQTLFQSRFGLRHFSWQVIRQLREQLFVQFQLGHPSGFVDAGHGFELFG